MGTFDVLGYNLRLSDIQAAVGVAQMAKLPTLIEDRRGSANRYLEALASLDELGLPTGGDKAGHTYQSFVIRVKEGGRKRRNALMAAMATANIQTRPGTHAVYRLGYYQKKYQLPADLFPHASAAEDTTITLPIVPFMKRDDQDRVIETLIGALKTV
jgi:dTDP-4-amino-4,6-dideoxygalactose transaminase